MIAFLAADTWESLLAACTGACMPERASKSNSRHRVSWGCSSSSNSSSEAINICRALLDELRTRWEQKLMDSDVFLAENGDALDEAAAACVPLRHVVERSIKFFNEVFIYRAYMACVYGSSR